MTRPADEQPVDQSHLVDDDGVDRSLIRWLLSLTPTERLQYLDGSGRMLAGAKRLPDGPDEQRRAKKYLQFAGVAPVSSTV